MTHRHRLWNVALCSLAALLSFAATCPPTQEPVTITFDQVGACNGYQTTLGLVGAGPNAAFVAFRIVSIDNSRSGQDFNFDPERISISGTSDFVSTNLGLAREQGPFKAIATTIPKGQNVGINRIAVVAVSTGAGAASEANNSSYHLNYSITAGDSGVLFAKRNLSQTSWPQTDNCRDVAGLRFESRP